MTAMINFVLVALGIILLVLILRRGKPEGAFSPDHSIASVLSIIVSLIANLKLLVTLYPLLHGHPLMPAFGLETVPDVPAIILTPVISYIAYTFLKKKLSAPKTRWIAFLTIYTIVLLLLSFLTVAFLYDASFGQSI